ncbi:hypothetical protein J6590_026204 [Homalodisca vitripennis]|nr:hypothetical protein J6590_026204 [Homalodisca vitripennis]
MNIGKTQELEMCRGPRTVRWRGGRSGPGKAGQPRHTDPVLCLTIFVKSTTHRLRFTFALLFDVLIPHDRQIGTD